MPTSVEVDILAPDFVEMPEHRLHALASALADSEHRAQEKPWTVWPLRATGIPTSAQGSCVLRLRLNWLPDTQPPDSMTHAMPQRLNLGKYACRVLNRTYHLATYPQLLGQPAANAHRIAFLRPTYFRSNGQDVSVPDGYLIVNSLLRRWASHSPPDARIPDDIAYDLRGSAHLTVVEGRQERIAERGHGTHTGFVGEGILTTDLHAQYLSALLRAMPYFGLGAGTTRGFGVAETEPLQ